MPQARAQGRHTVREWSVIRPQVDPVVTFSRQTQGRKDAQSDPAVSGRSRQKPVFRGLLWVWQDGEGVGAVLYSRGGQDCPRSHGEKAGKSWVPN